MNFRIGYKQIGKKRRVVIRYSLQGNRREIYWDGIPVNSKVKRLLTISKFKQWEHQRSKFLRVRAIKTEVLSQLKKISGQFDTIRPEHIEKAVAERLMEIKEEERAKIKKMDEKRRQLPARGRKEHQVHHAPPNPLSLLRDHLEFSVMKKPWDELRADSNYFPNGRMREDLKETLRVEWGPTIHLVEAIKTELEL